MVENGQIQIKSACPTDRKKGIHNNILHIELHLIHTLAVCLDIRLTLIVEPIGFLIIQYTLARYRRLAGNYQLNCSLEFFTCTHNRGFF